MPSRPAEGPVGPNVSNAAVFQASSNSSLPVTGETFLEKMSFSGPNGILSSAST